tara:strand:+ start:630 stop:1175 length:546 start_codon:yes stop_codon:yes gene_type:complete
MFNLSTQDAVMSIEKSPLERVGGKIYQEYQDFFGSGFSLPSLEGKKFVKLDSQELKPRIRLDYNDEMMKKITVFFMNSNITNALEKKFDTKLKFKSADLWVDDVGYFLLPHTDDDSIKLATQIYLSDDNVGTSLYDDAGKLQYTFPFRFNCGYSLYNGEGSHHGVEKIMKNGRTSLYVRYQ